VVYLLTDFRASSIFAPQGLQENVRRVRANKFGFHSVRVNTYKQKRTFALRVFKQEAWSVFERLLPCEFEVFKVVKSRIPV
jgi:hypothetical protein